MTYRPHILLAWGGRLGTLGESWSNQVRMTANTTSTAELENLAEQRIDDDIATKVKDLVGSAGGLYSTQAYLDWVKMNAIGADGRYSSDSESNTFFYAPPQTVGIKGQAPYQLAVVITFTTTAARGRGHQGRLYVPAGLVATDTGTIEIQNTFAVGAATAFATFLEAINDAPGLDDENLRAAVHSNVGTPGPVHDITGVKVGKFFDTQRRRRAQLRENYTAVIPVT
jgi:hypothetical protein